MVAPYLITVATLLAAWQSCTDAFEVLCLVLSKNAACITFKAGSFQAIISLNDLRVLSLTCGQQPHHRPVHREWVKHFLWLRYLTCLPEL